MPTKPLSAAEWQAVRALLDECLQLPADQRADFWQNVTADEPVKAEAQSLMSHMGADDVSVDDSGRTVLTGEFLSRHALHLLQAGDVTGAVDEADAAQAAGGAADLIGQAFGPWRITARLGSGGMGHVYRAQRSDGAYQGEVAVKVLKRGMDSDRFLRRFRQEQQALARMAHPHIARLFDAGLTPDGLPYMVMELVQGQAIDLACAGQPMEKRLGWFLQLADAVSHAHRNLLAHRDLKPSNVMVDEHGQVKLLDFGIAKALEVQDADGSALTQEHERPFTPHYASPEQVRGEPVTTTTDIYSLGVLLYVMLTGTRPYGRDAKTPMDAARCVLEEEPTRPSALSPGLVTDPQWMLNREKLRGDLDNILLKALDKSVPGRYPSVDALAADIRAHLDGFPVSARRSTWAYRARKYVARHRALTAAVAVGAVSLIGGSVATAWQAHVARQAQQVAEARLSEVRRITHELVFGFGDSVEYLPGGMKIKADLFNKTLAALDRLRPSLGEDAKLLADVAQVHVRLAEAYSPGYPASLNQPQQSQRHAEKAVALVEKLWPTQKTDPAFAVYASRAYSVVASSQTEAGRLEDALASSRQSLKLAEEALALGPRQGKDHLRLLSAAAAAQYNLALLLDDNGMGVGRPAEAMPMYEGALAKCQQQLAMPQEMAELSAEQRPEHTSFEAELNQTIGVIQAGIAASRLRRGHYEGAWQARRESVAALRKAQAMHPDQVQFWHSLSTALNGQAIIEQQMGRADAALQTSNESLMWTQRLLKGDPQNVDWLDDLEFRALLRGSLLADQGNHADALPWLKRAVGYWQAKQAKPGGARAKRTLALAEWRLLRTQMALAGAESNTLWSSATDLAQRVQALTQSDGQSADTWLILAEISSALGRDGPAAQREAWRRQGCAAWQQAELRRPLPPSVLPMRSAMCGGNGGTADAVAPQPANRV